MTSQHRDIAIRHGYGVVRGHDGLWYWLGPGHDGRRGGRVFSEADAWRQAVHVNRLDSK